MKLTRNRKTAYIYLLLNAIIWGAGLPIVKQAFNEGLDPYRFLLYRYFFASLIAIPILTYYLPKTKYKLQTLRKIVGLELYGLTLSLTLLYTGLLQTTSIEAGLISTATPILITLGGIYFFHEKEEKNESTGMIIAFTGTLLLTLLPVILNQKSIEFSLTGNLIILGQSIVSATYFIFVKAFYKGLPPFFVTAVSFYVGLFSFFLITWLDAGNLHSLIEFIRSDAANPYYIFTSFYMAFFGSIIALSLLIKGQDMIEISESSLFTYLQPLFALPIAVLWLGEKIHTLQIIALVLIATGVMIASRRVRKPLTESS